MLVFAVGVAGREEPAETLPGARGHRRAGDVGVGFAFHRQGSSLP